MRRSVQRSDKCWYRRGFVVDFMLIVKEVVTASLDNMSRKRIKREIRKVQKENQLIQDAEWKEIENNSEEN